MTCFPSSHSSFCCLFLNDPLEVKLDERRREIKRNLVVNVLKKDKLGFGFWHVNSLCWYDILAGILSLNEMNIGLVWCVFTS